MIDLIVTAALTAIVGLGLHLHRERYYQVLLASGEERRTSTFLESAKWHRRFRRAMSVARSAQRRERAARTALEALRARRPGPKPKIKREVVSR